MCQSKELLSSTAASLWRNGARLQPPLKPMPKTSESKLSDYRSNRKFSYYEATSNISFHGFGFLGSDILYVATLFQETFTPL